MPPMICLQKLCLHLGNCLWFRVRGQKCKHFNPLDNTQGAAIDVPYGQISNEMPMQLATVSLLILSTNDHQNVTHQSILSSIDCSHCHHWLFVSFCWVVNSTRSHPLHVFSLQCTLVYHVGTHAHTLQPLRRIWKSGWLTEQIHIHTSGTRHLHAQLSVQYNFTHETEKLTLRAWVSHRASPVCLQMRRGCHIHYRPLTQSSGTLRVWTASLECCFMTQLRLAQRSIQCTH